MSTDPCVGDLVRITRTYKSGAKYIVEGEVEEAAQNSVARIKGFGYVSTAEAAPYAVVVEVLKKAPPAEPPVNAIVIDTKGRAWQRRSYSKWYCASTVLDPTDWESLTQTPGNDLYPVKIVTETEPL